MYLPFDSVPRTEEELQKENEELLEALEALALYWWWPMTRALRWPLYPLWARRHDHQHAYHHLHGHAAAGFAVLCTVGVAAQGAFAWFLLEPLPRLFTSGDYMLVHPQGTLWVAVGFVALTVARVATDVWVFIDELDPRWR